MPKASGGIIQQVEELVDRLSRGFSSRDYAGLYSELEERFRARYYQIRREELAAEDNTKRDS